MWFHADKSAWSEVWSWLVSIYHSNYGLLRSINPSIRYVSYAEASFPNPFAGMVCAVFGLFGQSLGTVGSFPECARIEHQLKYDLIFFYCTRSKRPKVVHYFTMSDQIDLEMYRYHYSRTRNIIINYHILWSAYFLFCSSGKRARFKFSDGPLRICWSRSKIEIKIRWRYSYSISNQV